jgi:penicillin amidase
MRNSFVVVCLSSALLAACAGSEQPAALTISTAKNSTTVSGPMALTASEADVNWTITGSGTLSSNSGIATIYQPVNPPVSATTPATATVTATATDGRTASVTLTVGPETQLVPGGKIPGLTAAVSVLYDAEGIPHVFCQTAVDCFAVQGFLHAQDRLFQMDLFRRTAEGTLSTLIGQVEVSSDVQFRNFFTTRDGKNVTDQMAAAIDPASQAKLTAYVNGVNAYLAFLTANPGQMPGEYAQLPGTFTPGDIPAWTDKDSFAIGRLQQFQLSETIEEETGYGLLASVFGTSSPGRVGAYIHAQQPIRDYTIPLAVPAVVPAIAKPAAASPAAAASIPNLTAWMADLATVNAQMRDMHETFGSKRLGAGSNNWVVDGAHSATGKAMVANDPHLQLFYPSLFHLSAMTSGNANDHLDMAGGSFPGVPGALVGRGQHVGWGVTVVGYDVTDVYTETIDVNCGAATPAPVPCVSFKGQQVPMLKIAAPIAARAGAGAPNNFVYVVPHHGPMITTVQTFAANGSVTSTATTGLSMRWTGHEATNDFLGFFGLNTATAVGAAADDPAATTAIGALKNYKVGAQNFVLADDTGHIAYYPHALVPVRPWAGASNSQIPWFPVAADGSAEWGPGGATDCTTTATTAANKDCWVSDDLLPQSINPSKGFLVTANSDPAGYTDNGAFGTAGNPINNSVHQGLYLSFDWDDPTTVRFETITKFLTAKTTTGGKTVSVTDMQTIQSDHTIQLADLFLKAPLFPPTVPGNTSYIAAMAMMTAWKADGYACPTALTGLSPTSAAVTDATTLNDSASCLLFHVFLKQLLGTVFTDDFNAVQALAGTNPGADAAREIRTMLFMLNNTGAASGGPGNEFCNNVVVNATTKALISTTVSCSTQVVTAMVTAFLTISAELGAPPTKWTWGKFHTLTTLSPAAPLVANGFSGGPFARPGGAFSVDVGNPDGSQSTPLGMTYSHGSNVRFISEIQDPNASPSTVLMQLPGLEKDQPFGVFANTPDLLTPYAGNQYFTYLMSNQINANAVSSQGFVKP